MSGDLSPVEILKIAKPREKAAQARLFRCGVLDNLSVTCGNAPDWPARPDKPILVPARQLAKRKLGSAEGRAALLHAIAHIELNAIDLAADMIARFGDVPEIEDARDAFINDWSSVCDDEARHFVMIADRLDALGFTYGDFPAHNGLWDAAMNTSHDVAARLAIAPLVLEARGLDVTPGMIDKLLQAGDEKSANILKVIYKEEIGHVAIGMHWFTHVAKAQGNDPESLFHQMVSRYHAGGLKPPFNQLAREKAGFPPRFYEDIAASG